MRLVVTNVEYCKTKGYPIDELGDNYIIEISGNNVGIISANMYNNGLYIDYIEIDKEFRGYGYFRESLIRLMELYKVDILNGNATGEAAPKWKSLGAELEIDEDEDIALYDEIGECIAFELTLDRLRG